MFKQGHFVLIRHFWAQKDLHRTAYIGTNHEQQKLKKILLAYARFNPDCGYCQGFNIIVAFIMEVTTDDLGKFSYNIQHKRWAIKLKF